MIEARRSDTSGALSIDILCRQSLCDLISITVDDADAVLRSVVVALALMECKHGGLFLVSSTRSRSARAFPCSVRADAPTSGTVGRILEGQTFSPT